MAYMEINQAIHYVSVGELVIVRDLEPALGYHQTIAKHLRCLRGDRLAVCIMNYRHSDSSKVVSA